MEVLWRKIDFDNPQFGNAVNPINNKLAKEIYAKFRDMIEKAFNKICVNFKKKYDIDIEKYIVYRKELFANVIDDTIIDLNRLANFHPTKPNILKYVAYFVYWFTTRKPYQLVKTLENEVLNIPVDDQPRVLAKIYYFNEYLCSRLVFSAIFSNKLDCLDAEKCKSCLEDWKREKDDLFYYLVYRNVEPKGLEAYLRATTLHNQWKVNLKFC